VAHLCLFAGIFARTGNAAFELITRTRLHLAQARSADGEDFAPPRAPAEPARQPLRSLQLTQPRRGERRERELIGPRSQVDDSFGGAATSEVLVVEVGDGELCDTDSRARCSARF
jgi:hypothetical protein